MEAFTERVDIEAQTVSLENPSNPLPSPGWPAGGGLHGGAVDASLLSPKTPYNLQNPAILQEGQLVEAYIERVDMANGRVFLAAKEQPPPLARLQQTIEDLMTSEQPPAQESQVPLPDSPCLCTQIHTYFLMPYITVFNDIIVVL